MTAALVLLAGGGCPHEEPVSGPDRGRAASPRRVRAAPTKLPVIVLARPASAYSAPGDNGPVAALLVPLMARCRQALRKQGLELTADRRLHRAAARLLRVGGLGRVRSAALRFVLLGSGVPEPQARLIADDVASARELRKALSARLTGAAVSERFNRFGAAVRRLPGGRLRVVVLLLRAQVRLSPVPRHPAEATSVLVRGALTAGYTAPRAVLTVPGGATRPARLAAATDGSFHAVIPLNDGRGVYQLELLAAGPDGPEVLVNAPLYVGVPVPTRYALRPASRPARAEPVDARKIERALFAAINRARQRGSRPTLRWSVELARVARAHSVEMCRLGDVRHHSPTTGTASDRVEKARIVTRWVGENVGRAQSLHELHREFLDSPAHRAALLRKGLTHGGVGVCVNHDTGGRRSIYATELFIEQPPALRRPARRP